jgi:hypothetical protein
MTLSIENQGCLSFEGPLAPHACNMFSRMLCMVSKAISSIQKLAVERQALDCLNTAIFAEVIRGVDQELLKSRVPPVP